jgi:hypothetical protein
MTKRQRKCQTGDAAKPVLSYITTPGKRPTMRLVTDPEELAEMGMIDIREIARALLDKHSPGWRDET